MSKNIIIVLFISTLIFITACSKTPSSFDCEEFENQNFCLISNALLTDNLESCSILGEYSNLCTGYFGIRNNEYALCEDLDESNKLSCYLGIMFNKMDFEECHKHPYAFYTLSEIHGGAKEPQSENDLRTSCNYLILSQNRHNEDVCEIVPEGIQIEDWTGYCKKTLKQLSILAVPEMEMCEQDTSNSKGICYLEYATANLDLEACHKVDIPVLKDSCYYEIAVNTNNFELCPKNDKHPACVSRLFGLK